MFESISELLELAEKSDLAAWELIQQLDAQEQGYTVEQSRRQMEELYRVMRQTNAEYDGDLRSKSGLTGGDGALMEQALSGGRLLGGEYLNQVIAHALKTGESNACMRRIVAAPTAGACGVIPAVLLPLVEMGEITETEAVDSLYIGAAFGQVIASRASIAGAEGGCQAEIGTASAMAAGQLVYLRGGSLRASASACAMALSNLMGLVCDPVAGLVEVPCVKRNVIGAVGAVAAANMALAGIVTRIPVDEVIDAMGVVGWTLPSSLRETGEGGLAATPTGKRFSRSFCGSAPTAKDDGIVGGRPES